MEDLSATEEGIEGLISRRALDAVLANLTASAKNYPAVSCVTLCMLCVLLLLSGRMNHHVDRYKTEGNGCAHMLRQWYFTLCLTCISDMYRACHILPLRI